MPTSSGGVSSRSLQRRGGVSFLRDPANLPSTVLFRRYRQDKDRAARDALVRRFMPLAHNLARRYGHSAAYQEELTQVASLALVKAVHRFDPDRGSRFPAFAIPTILGELKRHFRDTGWAVHVPRSIQERALAIDQAVDELSDSCGRAPTVEQIADHLKLSCEEVLDGMQAAQAHEALSLDAPRGSNESLDNDATIGDTVGSEDPRFDLIDDDATLASVIQTLPERERRMLRLRFIEEQTQSEIAQQIGVSQMQVSRLLRRSIMQLRERAEATTSA